MQSNADTAAEFDGATWGEEEEDATIPGECDAGGADHGGLQSWPLSWRRERYALINPRIRCLLGALGGISAQMKGWKEGVGLDRLADLQGDTRRRGASSVGAITQGRQRRQKTNGRTKEAETGVEPSPKSSGMEEEANNERVKEKQQEPTGSGDIDAE